MTGRSLFRLDISGDSACRCGKGDRVTVAHRCSLHPSEPAMEVNAQRVALGRLAEVKFCCSSNEALDGYANGPCWQAFRPDLREWRY